MPDLIDAFREDALAGAYADTHAILIRSDYGRLRVPRSRGRLILERLALRLEEPELRRNPDLLAEALVCEALTRPVCWQRVRELLPRIERLERPGARYPPADADPDREHHTLCVLAAATGILLSAMPGPTRRRSR